MGESKGPGLLSKIEKKGGGGAVIQAISEGDILWPE